MWRKRLQLIQLMLMMLLMGNFAFGQTMLMAGDISITGVNMDNPDELSIVFLVNVETGTELRFTDNGWKADNTFRTGEGIFIWVAQQVYYAGDEIMITTTDMTLSSDGDQILVYQGDETTPQFITALNDEGEHTWQDDATNSNTSALPLGLVDGFTCIAVDETDNLIYNRSDTTGTIEELLGAINLYTNWTGSNSVRQNLSTAGYVVTVFEGQFPDRLHINSINNGYDPIVDFGFDVMIQAEDSTGEPLPVQQNTILSLIRITGTGSLSGPLSDTMYAGSFSVTFSGIQYNVAESGVTIMAVVIAGDGLASDTSACFEVITLPDIVINEIYYNGPESGEDTSEFIELYNKGIDAVNLTDYGFTQGISFVFPPQSVINPGEFMLVSKLADIYSGHGYQVFEWDNGTLSNEGESIELDDPLGHLIDQVTYGNGQDWGNGAPDGFGPSLELNDPALDNTLALNWKASYNNGGTPGEYNSNPPASAEWYGGTQGQEHNWAVPSNWQFQVSAGPTTDVTILSPQLDILTIDNQFTCNDLVLEPGAELVVKPGMTLTVNGDLLVKSSPAGAASICLEDDDAELIVLGNSTIEQYITGGVLKDPENAVYHFISSPVDDALAGNVFPGTAYLRAYNEPEQVWENLTATDAMDVMKGYSVWLEEGSATVSFEGNLNSGELTFGNLLYTGPGINNYNSDYAGFNLVGNPYPSCINWEHPDVIKTNINNAVYFWNPELQGYSSYIDGIGNNPETTDSIIPAMQGFFVRVNQIGNTGSLSVKNDVRVPLNKSFYKTAQSDILRLTVTDEDRQDQTTIRYKSSATSGFDSLFDAFKLPGSALIPQIYSMCTEDVKLSINTLPSIEDNGIVPIGFYGNESGIYSITVSGIENFNTDISISLEDLKENVIIDCRQQQSYEFDYEMGEADNRFLLHLVSTLSTIENPKDALSIRSYGKVLYLKSSGNQTIKEVIIYDLKGDLVMCEKTGDSGFCRIRLNDSQTIYIIKVITDSHVYSQKILIY